MKRRDFFKKTFVGTLVLAITPQLLAKVKPKTIPPGIYTTQGMIPFLTKSGISYKTHEDKFGTLVIIPHPLLTEEYTMSNAEEMRVMFGVRK